MDNDGALLALTLLGDSSGGVYRFAPDGKVSALFEGEPFKAKLTCVVGADDCVFAVSLLVRRHEPSGKTQALGVNDVVQLAVSDALAFLSTASDVLVFRDAAPGPLNEARRAQRGAIRGVWPDRVGTPLARRERSPLDH